MIGDDARGLARFAVETASEVAQRTRGHRRGKLIEKDGAEWIIQYGRGQIRSTPKDLELEKHLVPGLTVTLELVDGMLQIGGSSAFQGSFDVPS